MNNLINKDGKVTIPSLFLAGFMVFLLGILLVPSLSADILFYDNGPYNSQHFLKLTDFRVEGPAEPRIGAEITVSFTLSNFSQEIRELTDKGVFAAVRDPDGRDRSFGFIHGNENFELGQEIDFSQTFVVDKSGEWRIWPSYQIWVEGTVGAPRHRENGPDEWDGSFCSLEISPGKPDLEAYGVTWMPETPTVGRVVLKPLVRNIGESTSLKCEGTFFVNGEKLSSVSLSEIPAGKRLAEVEEVAAEWSPSKEGDYSIQFIVDSSGVVDESDETNNMVEVSLSVLPSDNTPPTVAVTRSPESSTEMDNVTFHVEASDPIGIDFITLNIAVIGGEHEIITRHDTTSFVYTGGPYPRRSTVKYSVQAADKAGNVYLTSWEDFRIQSFYTEPLTVNVSRFPQEPTNLDNVTFTATASFPYEVQTLSIYLNGVKAREVENEKSCSVTGGLWPEGSTISYYAEAYANGQYGRTTTMRFTVGGLRTEKNLSSYSDKEVFMISDLDWRAVLSLVPTAIWRHGSQIFKYPVLIYHQENSEVFDADAVIHFLQRYHPDHVAIFGDPPDRLVELLEASPPLGSGLSDDQITIWISTVRSGTVHLRLDMSPLERNNFRNALDVKWNTSITISEEGYGVSPTEDILSDVQEKRIREHYWDELGVYVICEDEYSTGLLASVYASIINAPILFQDHYDPEEISRKYVYLIGNFSEEEVSVIEERASIRERFSLEELQQNFRRYYIPGWYGSPNKVLLVNPMDLWTHAREGYYPEKSGQGGKNRYTFSKHSLAAPFLAASKGEIILSVPSLNYIEIDEAIKDFMDTLSGYTSRYLTIVASPETIPIARPNFHYPLAFDGTYLYYETYNFNDCDIVRRNINDNSISYLSMNPAMQISPVASNQLVAWREDDNIYYLWEGEIHLKERNGRDPAVYEDILVYRDPDDIVMYEPYGSRGSVLVR